MKKSGDASRRIIKSFQKRLPLHKGGSVNLNIGDKILRYTDGVTEATDINNKLYGMERLTAVLNTCHSDTPKDTLEKE